MTDDDPTPKKRKWLAIVLGVLLRSACWRSACVWIAVSYFRQNMEITRPRRSGDARAGRVRARFPGQQPLIQLVDGKPQWSADAPARPRRKRRSARCM
jgi:hypothetical protein